MSQSSPRKCLPPFSRLAAKTNQTPSIHIVCLHDCCLHTKSRNLKNINTVGIFRWYLQSPRLPWQEHTPFRRVRSLQRRAFHLSWSVNSSNSECLSGFFIFFTAQVPYGTGTRLGSRSSPFIWSQHCSAVALSSNFTVSANFFSIWSSSSSAILSQAADVYVNYCSWCFWSYHHWFFKASAG